MKKAIIKGILPVCLVLGGLQAMAQDNEWQMYNYEDYTPYDPSGAPKGNGYSYNGGVFTPKGTLKCLVIYAGFYIDDNDDLNDQYLYKWAAKEGNNYNVVPEYAKDGTPKDIFFSTVAQLNDPQNASVKNLTRFYSEMSHGKFILLGDVFKDPATGVPVRINIDPTGAANWAAMNRKVIQKAMELYPTFNWAPYDNRANHPNYLTDNSASSPDMKPDYVVIAYRWSKGWTTQPVAGILTWQGSSGAYSILDGLSGLTYNGYSFTTAGYTACTSGNSGPDFMGLYIHELAHELYNCPHIMGANSTFGNYFTKANGWGMMSNIRTIYTANAWESWLLGWNELVDAYGVTTDIKSATDLNTYGTYVLSDFVTTGNAMRIKIPNTDNTYLWIENHQKKTLFDYSSWKGCHPSPEGELVPDIDAGLYMYTENVWPTRENFSLTYWNMNRVNAIKPLNAQGNYDYTHSDLPLMVGTRINPDYYWDNRIYTFQQTTPCQIGGTNPWYDFIDDFASFNGKYFQSDKNGAINWVNDFNGGTNERESIVRETNGTYTNMLYINTYGSNVHATNSFGYRSDAFLVGDKLGLTGNIMATNIPTYNQTTAQIGETYLNGLSVEVLSKTTYGDCVVKIKFNDYSIYGDKRWTGCISLPDLTSSVSYDLILENSATLKIDKSGIPNRHTKLNGEFVNPSVFTIMAGARMLTRQASVLTIDNGSTLVLETNSKIVMEQLSQINVTNNSTLILKTGAEIVNQGIFIDATSKIVFDGGTITTSSLRLDGTLKITANNSCELAGGEAFYLNGIIDAETGASFSLIGNYINSTLVKVQKAITFSPNLTSVTIRNGKIVMANSTSKLYISRGPSLTVDNVLVTSSTGAYNGHYGIAAYGNSVSISNSTFEYGYYGLYTMRQSTDALVALSNCTFQYNATGALAYNSGVDADGCSFSNNTNYGLRCMSMDLQSDFDDCSFSSNAGYYGLYYEGTSTSSFTESYCSANSNNSGVYVSGPLNAMLTCCNIRNNTSSGISAYNNASLHLEGTSYGANDLSGNKYGIHGGASSASNIFNYFYLNNGYNDLRDNATSGAYSMFGYFGGYASGNVTANNNRWKSGGGAPVNGTDYVLYGAICNSDLSSCNSLTLSDNSPESVFAECEAISEPGTLSLTSSSIVAYSGTATTSEVTTSLGTSTLDETVKTILNETEGTGTVYTPEERFNLLGEVLMLPFEKPNEADQWYLNQAYRHFRKTVGQIDMKNRDISGFTGKFYQVAGKLGEERKGKGRKTAAKIDFETILDQAYALWYQGDFDMAVTTLRNAQSSLSNSDATYFDQVICKINLDRDVQLYGYDGDIALATEECEKCKKSQKSDDSSTGSGSGELQGEIMGNLLQEISLSIVPNPVTGISNIEITLPGQTAAAKLVVINSAGQKVMEQTIATGQSKVQVSKGQLPAGLYLVNLSVDGQMVAAEKMMVVE
jgi:hypothetical protein